MSQTRIGSLTEATLNTASGFVISLVASYFIYPRFGFHPTWGQITSLTIIFTVISVARSYAWRRLFNKRISK